MEINWAVPLFSLIIRIVFVFVIFFLELSLIIHFVFVFVIFCLELSIYKDVSWFRPLILVFIQHLNHYFVDRVLITNNYKLNILPYHKINHELKNSYCLSKVIKVPPPNNGMKVNTPMKQLFQSSFKTTNCIIL